MFRFQHSLLCFGLLMLSCISGDLMAQSKAGNVWYFGTNVGLNFNEGADFFPPPNAMETSEGSAIICDEDGEVMFYSNGGGRTPDNQQPTGTIWNRNDLPFYEMEGLEGGGWSSIQSSVIVPVPGQTDRYYLFTMDEAEGDIDGTPIRGLSVFEVDMTANGGLGAVVDYQESIFPEVTEGLAACRHANGTDYWLAVYDRSETSYQFLLVNGAGINPTQRFLAPAFLGPNIGAAPLRFSPDGEHFYAPGVLYNFNAATGEISMPQDIVYSGSYGASFSPNSAYLYLYGDSGFGSQNIVRFSTKVADVPATEEEVVEYMATTVTGQMQVAPDGNIYYLESDFLNGETLLSSINCPNTATPCIERNLAIFESTDLPTFGLPNFIDHIFANDDLGPEILLDIEASNEVICIGESTTLTAIATAPAVDYAWSNGANTESIIVDQPGIYSVTVTNGCCNSGTEEIEILLAAGTLNLEIAGDTLLCEEDFTVLTAVAPEGQTFTWSNGESSNNIAVTTSGIYSVTVTNDCGFIAIDSVEVTFLGNQPPAFNTMLQDNLCFGEREGTIELIFAQQTPPYQFAWWDSQGNLIGETASLLNLPAGNYRLEIQEIGTDCIFSFDYVIDQPTALEVTSFFEPLGCEATVETQVDITVQGGSPDYLYQWEPDSSFVTDSSLLLSPGQYVVTVQDVNGCEQTSPSILIEAPDSLSVSLDGPTELVPMGDPFILALSSDRNFAFLDVVWTPAERVSCVNCVQVVGTVVEDTKFQATISSEDGCSTTVEILVRADLTRRFYVPNAFSPNGDGQNDWLQVYPGEGVAEVLQFKIFNRWGALLHDHPEDVWNGQFRGKALEGGIYVWWAEVAFGNGDRVIYEGDVLLVR